MNKVILNDIIDVISGGTPKTSINDYWENGEIGWLSVTDFNDDLRYVYNSEKKITNLGVKESNTKFLNRGDIIISARGTVGALAQIGVPMCFNQSCFGIRGKEDIVDNDFLYYALKNYVKHIIKRSQGSVFDTINLASFNLMELEIPKLIITQKQIAKVLSDLDAKIEINNKINTELEAMAKTIYDYWFVQFDFPDENGKPYKSSGGAMVYNEALKREIPEGWEVRKLDEIAKINAGGDKPKIISSFKTKDCNIPIYSNGTTNEGLYGYTTISKIKEQSITVSARGTIGYTVLRNEPYLPIIRLISVTPKIEGSAPFYYYEVKKLVFENSGSVQQQLTKPQISRLQVLNPNINVLQEFVKIVSPMIGKQESNKKENQKLAELRDWLLPMLMNGQVTIKEAQKSVNKAVEV
ncbi:restriction endonuclease subunit S [Flavobacterium sp. LaA7.5]|nr:restriction endonuclease subunit S [Flavobacterium salilacus subsp. altitudinum]